MFRYIEKKLWVRKFQELIGAAHVKSQYRDKPRKWFEEQVFRLSRKELNEIDFNEELYLEANSDVQNAVNSSNLPCGYLHYIIYGSNEYRLYSNKSIENITGEKAMIGKGLFEPSSFSPLVYKPDLSNLSYHPSLKTMVILIPYLKKELFFAGYTAFFTDLIEIFPLFDRVVTYVFYDSVEESLLKKYAENITVKKFTEISQLEYRPNLIYAFDFEMVHQAKDVFSRMDDVIYYCQDDEAGFHPFGSMFVRARQSIYAAKNIIFSTKMLHQYFIDNDCLSDKCNVFITAPLIESIDGNSSRGVKNKQDRKKIFFYYRPEKFNSRNLDRIIVDAVYELAEQRENIDLYLVGTVATSFSICINDVNIFVISKLPKDEYSNLLFSCDLCVSMIYSAHPGVIAYQAAASGIPTITNTFSNRNADDIRKISDNLIPYDPVRDNLSDIILHSWDRPLGNHSFNYDRYAGLTSNTCSFVEYHLDILRANNSGEDKWMN
jgi:hypothetical protein